GGRGVPPTGQAGTTTTGAGRTTTGGAEATTTGELAATTWIGGAAASTSTLDACRNPRALATREPDLLSATSQPRSSRAVAPVRPRTSGYMPRTNPSGVQPLRW